MKAAAGCRSPKRSIRFCPLRSLRRPSALFLDGEGSLWIADTSNHRVRKVERFLDDAPGRR